MTESMTRRDFVKGVVAGAVVAAIAAIGLEELRIAGMKAEKTTITSTQTTTTTVPTTITSTTTVGAETVTVTSTTTTTTTVGEVPVKEPVESRKVMLTVNGEAYEMYVEARWTLAKVLRSKLMLTGTKVACDRGECGGCTVIIDGNPVLSCTMLAIACEGREITTIEGISDGLKLHPLQQSFIDYDGVQCGVCTPGIILTAKALLDDNPNPTKDEVMEAISGNICKCGAYKKIVESIMAVAGG